MTRSSIPKIPSWTWLALFWGGICAMLPLRSAFQLDPDEGYELMKSFLVSRGYHLYSDVWDDQPPLHTECIALLFRLFEPSVFICRLTTALFAIVLLISVFEICKHFADKTTGYLAVWLIVSSTFFVQLGASALLEIPAVSLMVAAIAVSCKFYEAFQARWLIFSGILIGLSLQVKFTAALLLPTVLVVHALRRHLLTTQHRFGSGPGRALSIHVAASCLTFLLAFCVFSKPAALHIFWRSHFSHAVDAASSQLYRWQPYALLDDIGLCFAAAFAMLWFLSHPRREYLIGLVTLGFVVAIHWVHRPFWYYYKIHYIIPLSVFAAMGMVKSGRAVCIMIFDARKQLRGPLVCLIFVYAVCAIVVSLSTTSSLIAGIQSMRSLSRVNDSTTFRLISQSKYHAKFIFTDQRTAAFRAKLLIPPEIAIIPSKRIWSGQISREEILTALERHSPELILIPTQWEEQFDLSEYLAKRYDLDSSAQPFRLFVKH
jgi:4-amino-4-deoxy-L-arabinose transferase-like glycosyltransferase